MLTQLEKTRMKAWMPWLVGAVIATLLLVFIFTCTDMNYDQNDDAVILSTTMGSYGGELPSFHYIIGPLLLYPLNALTTAFGSVAWFSVLQMALLWLSTMGIVRGLMCAFENRGKCPWIGMVVSALFVAACVMEHCSTVTFTITASLLGACAVAQILAVDCERGTRLQIVGGMALSLVFVVLGHSLRAQNTLPTLAFCAIAFLFQWFGYANKAGNGKAMLQSALLVVICLALLLGIRTVEIKAKGMEDYLDFQSARSAVIDYDRLDNLPSEVLADIGWSNELYEAVKRWYFLDDAVNTEAFETILAYHETLPPTPVEAKIEKAKGMLETFVKEETLTIERGWLFLALAGLCAVSILAKRKGMGWCSLALLCTVLGAVLMIAYLAYAGRMPERAVASILYPAMMVLLGLLPSCLHLKGLGILGTACMGLVCVWLVWQCGVMTIDAIIPKEVLNDETEGLNAFAALNDLALDWEETLYITDDTLIADLDMFPDMSQGRATNVVFWGGWTYRSPEYMALFERYGIDLNNMDGSALVNNPDVMLARGAIEPLPLTFIAYLNALEGEEVNCLLMDEWGGAYTFELYH